MTDLEIYQLYRDQFRAIDANLDKLANACTTFAQSQQLSDEWNQANVNYVNARNKIFAEDLATVQTLATDLKTAQDNITTSIQELKEIAATLDTISNGIRIASNLLALATPRPA